MTEGAEGASTDRYEAELRRLLTQMLGNADRASELCERARLLIAPIERKASEEGMLRVTLLDIGTELAIQDIRRRRGVPDCTSSDLVDRLRRLSDCRSRLPQVIDSLPSELKQVFALRFVSKLSIASISAELRLPHQLIERRLEQALSRCRTEINDEAIVTVAPLTL